MIDWASVLSFGIVPVGFLALGLWATWLNRDLLKPQRERDHHTPAE
jgi:hypothetical protein